MARKRVEGKSNAKIAQELAPFLGIDKRVAEIYVHRWLKTPVVPSRENIVAIYKAGYQIEPFIFGVEDWKRLKSGEL